MTVRFDDSLPILATIIVETLGEASLTNGVVLRDVSGRLSFFLSKEIDDISLKSLSLRLHEGLGVYCRSDRPIANPTDPGAQAILNDSSALNLNIKGIQMVLVDRRMVGADWLRQPAEATRPPPRFIFASLKGGVGRTTALSIVAANLAAQGHRVLAIDLDLEAPGLGSILLNNDTLPEFGLIDALVEGGLYELDDQFLVDLVGPSELAAQKGKIDVIPAFGRRSLQNPGDVLSKIARAYVEQVNETGQISTFLDHVKEIVERFSDPLKYDVILIDSRAGLHETAPAAILGLGGEVFLFGLDEPQTFQGYSALFGHLSRFIRQNQAAPEWLSRLTMVQGRALDLDHRLSFQEKCKELFVEAGLLRRYIPAPKTIEDYPFNNLTWNEDVPDEDVLPHDEWEPILPLAIMDDDRFKLFEPLKRRDLLSEQVYKLSFQQLLDRVNESVAEARSR